MVEKLNSKALNFLIILLCIALFFLDKSKSLFSLFLGVNIAHSLTNLKDKKIIYTNTTRRLKIKNNKKPTPKEVANSLLTAVLREIKKKKEQ